MCRGLDNGDGIRRRSKTSSRRWTARVHYGEHLVTVPGRTGRLPPPQIAVTPLFVVADGVAVAEDDHGEVVALCGADLSSHRPLV